MLGEHGENSMYVREKRERMRELKEIKENLWKKYGKERGEFEIRKEPEEIEIVRVLENIKNIEDEIDRKKLERENERKLKKEMQKLKAKKKKKEFLEKYTENNPGVDKMEELATSWRLIEENVEEVERMMTLEAELLENQNVTPRQDNVTVSNPSPTQPSRPIYKINNPLTPSDIPNYNPSHRGAQEEPEQVTSKPNVTENVTVPGTPNPIQPSCPIYKIINPRPHSDCPNYFPSHRGSPEEQPPGINIISGGHSGKSALNSEGTDISSGQPKDKVKDPSTPKPTDNVIVRDPTKAVIVRQPTKVETVRVSTNNREGHHNNDQDTRRPNLVNNVTVSNQELDDDDPLQNLAEELVRREFTERKNSLLKHQIKKLKVKFEKYLQAIAEESYEDQKVNKKVTVFYKNNSRTLTDIPNYLCEKLKESSLF